MPDPFRSREDLPKPKKKKKKKKVGGGGGFPSANVYVRTHAHTQKKSSFRHFRLSNGELGRREDFCKFSFQITTKPKP